jgi:D-alanyl-D-alanine carboxypeptidase (penicillin-binding protein 5/6)
MRTSRRLQVLLAVAPMGLAVLLAPAAHADEPLGGARLAGPEVVTGDPADPLPPPTTAAAYVVADLDTGEVLAAKDPHGRYAPASTLKMLTAVTLLPRLDPAAAVTPTFEDVAVDGTRVGLVQQLSYSVNDLFTALLATSANDAAGALATAVGGQAAATALMNDEAARLQARDTRAVNTSGLDAEGQVSSAYDLALVARAGLARPDFRAYVAVRRAFIPAPAGRTIEIANHNRLLGTYPGAIGVKNGYTDAARASFVGAATRDGHTVLVTLMRGEPVVWQEAAQLLDWGFAAVARDARPVGALVDPVSADDEADGDDGAGAPAAAPVAQPAGLPPVTAGPADEGGLPVAPAATAIAVVGGVVLLRRQAVVQARSRRRVAQRASEGSRCP